MTFNEKIVTDVVRQREFIAALKEKSGYYPQITTGHLDDRIYISTLVRIERDNTWYVVHCVESYVDSCGGIMMQAMKRFVDSVYKVQHLYQITGKFEDVDELQISEKERLSDKH